MEARIQWFGALRIWHNVGVAQGFFSVTHTLKYLSVGSCHIWPQLELSAAFLEGSGLGRAWPGLPAISLSRSGLVPLRCLQALPQIHLSAGLDQGHPLFYICTLEQFPLLEKTLCFKFYSLLPVWKTVGQSHFLHCLLIKGIRYSQDVSICCVEMGFCELSF